MRPGGAAPVYPQHEYNAERHDGSDARERRVRMRRLVVDDAEECDRRERGDNGRNDPALAFCQEAPDGIRRRVGRQPRSRALTFAGIAFLPADPGDIPRELRDARVVSGPVVTACVSLDGRAAVHVDLVEAVQVCARSPVTESRLLSSLVAGWIPGDCLPRGGRPRCRVGRDRAAVVHRDGERDAVHVGPCPTSSERARIIRACAEGKSDTAVAGCGVSDETVRKWHPRFVAGDPAVGVRHCRLAAATGGYRGSRTPAPCSSAARMIA